MMVSIQIEALRLDIYTEHVIFTRETEVLASSVNVSAVEAQ